MNIQPICTNRNRQITHNKRQFISTLHLLNLFALVLVCILKTLSDERKFSLVRHFLQSSYISLVSGPAHRSVLSLSDNERHCSKTRYCGPIDSIEGFDQFTSRVRLHSVMVEPVNLHSHSCSGRMTPWMRSSGNVFPPTLTLSLGEELWR